MPRSGSTYHSPGHRLPAPRRGNIWGRSRAEALGGETHCGRSALMGYSLRTRFGGEELEALRPAGVASR
jgi:hypothetical protein